MKNENMVDSLSIVIAAYNEQESLAPCVKRTNDFLQQYSLEGEIIIVNDGSTDQTGRIIEELVKEFPNCKGIQLDRNRGMGGALLKGFQQASKTWITMLPADGQIDAFQLKKLLDHARDVDVVTSLYSNRYYGVVRKIISVGFRVLTTLIMWTRAKTDGTYLIKKEVLKKVNPSSNSFLLNLEIPILAKRKKYRLSTVYIEVSPRMSGHSKAITIRRIFHVIRELVLLRFRM